jgi:PKD repeat protein
MTWTYSGNSSLLVDITNRVATVSAPNPDWFGLETITFAATDPGGLSDLDPATFTLTAVNDAPVVFDIPDQIIDEGASFAAINLDDYVNDVDDPDSNLTWTYSGNTDLSVTIDANRIATILAPDSDWIGMETITFRASDDSLAFSEDAATFTINIVNYAPVVSDIPVYGSVSGSYLNTYSSDNVYETITEIQYTGHPVKTYSYLEHKWNFNIDASSGATFYLEAYRPTNADGDNFIFAYSTDDVNYYNLVTVASATEQIYTASLPAITGIVYIRVLDSQREWETNSLDPVYVDEMYIEYSSAPVPPTANFTGNPTSGFTPLAVQLTDISTGSPTSWSWDFGDGIGTSTAQNPSYTYNNPGTYTVSLTATNQYGSDTETKVDYITATEQGNNYCYVYDMTVSRRTAGPNCSGQCWTTIYNSSGQPLANATVYLDVVGPVAGIYSTTTDADGVAFAKTAKSIDCTAEWCFEVIDVSHATFLYDAGSNNVTQACESGWVYGRDGIASASLQTPDQFTLEQNRPNPFNPVTEIAFSLPKASQVKLEIFNIMGQRVAMLGDGYYEAGCYSVTWDASEQASGIYFYRISTDNFIESKKMILLK